MGIDLSAVSDFIAARSAWAMPIVFLVVFCESFAFLSLLVPGTAILAASGALVGAGVVSLAELLGAAIPAAILGDAASYWLGWRYGPQIIAAWPFRDHPEMVAKGQRSLNRFGAMSVFVGRFFGPLRAVVPLMAGMARMPRGPFMLANVGSAVVWAPVILLPGALVGWAAERNMGAGWWMLAAAALSASAAAAYVAWRRRA